MPMRKYELCHAIESTFCQALSSQLTLSPVLINTVTCLECDLAEYAINRIL